MIYAFLFLAAFLYFVADRKIRLSILPGIFVTLMACYAMLYRLAVFNYTRSGYKTIPSYLLDLTNGNIRTALGISVIPLLAVVGTIIVVAFLFLGKAIGRVIFNPSLHDDESDSRNSLYYFFNNQDLRCFCVQ